MVEANTSLSPAERMKSAVFTRALQRAKAAVKRQIQAQGHKLAQYSCRDITLLAEDYLNQHRAELIAEAKVTVECWIAEGVFGKKATTPSEPKSITSAVQNSGAEWRADQ